MATSAKDAKCCTVGSLKAFLADIPDNTPIRGDFDDRVRFFLWKKDKDESGPRLWLGMDDDY